MFSCVTANNYLYCMGGDSGNNENLAQYAKIPSSGGAPGTWTSQSTNTLPQAEFGESCVTANNYLYCMGGSGSGVASNYVDVASIPSGGGPTGAWTSQATNTLAVSESQTQSCVVTPANYIYCVGGGDWGTSVQYAVD
jgi:hypothetical protein